MEDQPELFSDLSLNTLIRGSLIIAFITIQSKNSRLVRNGDYIVTDYVFQPVEVFKGVFSKNESFSASGGKVVFPDATSAEITTVEWQTLAVGGQYILFLSESGDHYELTNGVESVFKISPSGTSLIPLASFDDSRPHAVLKDVRNYTPDSFKAFIRIQAASKK